MAHGRLTLEHVLRYARNQIGTPYRWGGAQRGGFDCSGLVYWAYRKAGYTGIGRTTYDQIKQGQPVGRDQLVPGDIVFPSTEHEGLYIGNGMILEAPHTGDHVKIIPLSQFGFLTARRLLHGGGGIIPPRGIGGVSQSGLPVPSQNPADRLPHGGASRAAALATLLSLHAPSPVQQTWHAPTPHAVVQGVDQQPGQQQPQLGDVPQPAEFVTPGGSTPSQLQSSLDATRQQLLKV